TPMSMPYRRQGHRNSFRNLKATRCSLMSPDECRVEYSIALSSRGFPNRLEPPQQRNDMPVLEHRRQMALAEPISPAVRGEQLLNRRGVGTLDLLWRVHELLSRLLPLGPVEGWRHPA